MERARLASMLVAAVFGVMQVGLGIWALVDTTSFYDNVAEFPPYNYHFLHDLGAFQLGIGVALLCAVAWQNDAILAALGGASAGAIAHGIVHITDQDYGGKDSDPYTLMLIAIIVSAAFVLRFMARTQDTRRN